MCSHQEVFELVAVLYVGDDSVSMFHLAIVEEIRVHCIKHWIELMGFLHRDPGSVGKISD